MRHPWLAELHTEAGELNEGNVSRLNRTSMELNIAAKLEGLGFNVPDILNSVHSNACNQLAARNFKLIQYGI
jgi:hypothetical protein